MKFHTLVIALVSTGAAMLAGCDNSQEIEQVRKQAQEQIAQMRGQLEQALTGIERLPEDVPQRAVAVLHPTAGNDVAGTVTFTPFENGLRVAAQVAGLSPGEHGYHLHIYGDCTAADGTSAGPHFNLEGSSLNPPEDIERVTGDLGNLEAGGDGKAVHEAEIENAELTGPKSIIGRAVVVHAKPTDYSQPPGGAAGARQACGVIGIGKPKG